MSPGARPGSLLSSSLTSLPVRMTLPLLPVVALAACSEESPGAPDDATDGGPRFASCDLPIDFLWVAQARDGIVSLDEPDWDRAARSVPDYLDPDTRVIGVMALGIPWAIPHNVLWFHEIVNFAPGGPNGPALAATYCPLTGSSLVFDRASVNRATLGISGFIFMNNLMMYDRRDPSDTLWPQMMAEARCGSRIGSHLTQWPFVEMEWAEWRRLHPDTYVLAGAEAQGFDPVTFDYTSWGYPYGTYREIESFFFATLMPFVDKRRFPKERVVGLPSTAGDPGIAFPFGALEAGEGDFRAVEFLYEGQTGIVLWSDRAHGGSAYHPRTEEGNPVTLRTSADGFVDDETGSLWTVAGRAVSGPREGSSLDPIEDALTAFWGAWAVFHTDTRLWEG